MEELEKQTQNTETEKTPAKKPQKTWKKVLRVIFTVVVIVVLAFCVIVVVQAKSAKKPFLFGYATFYVLTGSMEPVIHVGDVIIDESVHSIEDLQVGDIITYRGKEGEFAGKTVTHKIQRIEGDKIVPRGVSTMSIKDDPAITFDDVVGRYVKTSAFLTTVYSIFTSKYGFLLIVFIPLIILLIIQIVNFRRACRMDDDGKLPEEKSAEEIKEKAVKEKEEEIKRKAIEDYLASKKRIEEAERKHKK